VSQVYTLLLRLEGPMQSWGYRSRFDYRDTALEPTRSGVLGLVCAAMGIAREEDLSRFNPIRMGVRVDREGRPERDYHTALDVIKADGRGTGTVVSYRDYLADASFVAGLESRERELLQEIEAALRTPKWFLFLGRKAFPLTVPPLISSLRTQPLEEALAMCPYSPRRGERRPKRLRTVIEVRKGTSNEVFHDVPISFETREFRNRYVQRSWITIPTPQKESPCISRA
jgi:CRISPR system Cascade subunit CasD